METPLPPATARCAECLREFPTSELMRFAEFFSCADCKPVVVEKIKRGLRFGTFWRWGPSLVAAIPPSGIIEFPARCAECNQPTQGNPTESEIRIRQCRATVFRYFLCDEDLRRKRSLLGTIARALRGTNLPSFLRHTDDFVMFCGCSERFLRGFPKWPES